MTIAAAAPALPTPLAERFARRAWALLQGGVPLSLLLDLADPRGPRSELLLLQERPTR